MNNCCNPKINDSDYLLSQIINQLKVIGSTLENLPSNSDSIMNLERMQAHLNPMTVAAEYPTVEDGKLVVSTPVRFLDMLNSDMYVIFKIDVNDRNLPIYFKDAIEYEHPIVLSDATPVLDTQIQLNGIYKAMYQYEGGYIILDSLTPLNPNVIPV